MRDNHMRDKGTRTVMLGGAAVLITVSLLALCLGAVPLSLADVFRALFSGENGTAERILFYVRLPRLLAAALSGVGLAVSGVVIQTVLANPLASPGIIGVNAGAGFFAALAMALLPRWIWAIPAAAFLGALLTVLLVYGVARKAGASRMTLILSGVAVSSLMTAGINLLSNLYPELLRGLRDFQVGGFAGVSSKLLLPAGIVIGFGLIATLFFGGELEILGLGQESALSLGLNVRWYRFVFLTLAAALASAAVSFAGLLGFVGLMVPHMARLFLRDANERAWIGASALLGAAFLVLCDTAARTAFAPHELPVGILVSFLGVPFFLRLLLRGRRRHD